MPVETRYFRSDSQTVNGLTANKLLTSQSGVAGYVTSGQFIGIRVWRRLADGTEIEITGGTAVAIADTDSADGIYSATWNCPETQLNPTDVIVVRVYSGGASPPTTLIGTWITEQLGASKLDASTWTVYYYSDYTYTKRTRHLPDCSSEQLETESWAFRFDTATYNSRIKGFAWTSAGVPHTVEVSDSGVVAEVLGKDVGVVEADSFLGFDVSTMGLVTCVSDSGVGVDFSAKDCLKFLGDIGVGFDWFSKDVAPCLMDMGVSLDLLLRGVGKCLADVGLVGDWKSFDLLSCVLDVLKGLDWVPFGVPHVVELRDVFGVYELFNLPPLIVDLNKVWDRIDAYVKVGVQTWLYLWDKVFISDFTIPWDVGKVKELVVAIGWILRDYPLTEWELKRSERIVNYLGENKVFRLSDFQRYVWFEQVHMQEQRAYGSFSKQMWYYRSRYIENFCKHLFTVLEEKGYVKKVGLDSFIVLEVPSVEFVNEVARRRIYDIWSFVG